MESVLITGGCGFIGRNLVMDLVRDGVPSIVIVDDLSTGIHPDQWLPAKDRQGRGRNHVEYLTDNGTSAHFILGDAREALGTKPDTPGEFLSNMDFAEIYHLAARVGGRVALETKPLTIAENLAIDASFFSWVAEHSAAVGRVLYMSSSAVYPVTAQSENDSKPLGESLVDEMSVKSTDGMYGWAKLTGEILARSVTSRYDVPVSCVRLFSGYGSDQDLTYPVPAIAERAMRRQDPLTVWGPGDQKRDFVHVSDAIFGMRLAIRRKLRGSAVNVGTGVGLSMTEVAIHLAEAFGYRPAIATDPSKPVGVQTRIADISRMSDELGWVPHVSAADGLSKLAADFETTTHGGGSD